MDSDRPTDPDAAQRCMHANFVSVAVDIGTRARRLCDLFVMWLFVSQNVTHYLSICLN